MSKSVKIIGSVVVVSALWLGGTAYVSSNTETYLERYVNKTNKLYEANGIKISVEKFEKGFFSSNAKMKLDFTDAKMKELFASTLKLPLMMEYKIENGPLLFKNGLGIGLSRMSNHINLNDYFVEDSELKKSLKNEIVFDSMTTVKFNKNSNFEASTSEIVLDVDGEELKIAPISIVGEMNIETFQGEMEMESNSMFIAHEDEFFKAQDITMSAKINEFFDNGFYLGDFKFKAGDISTKGIDLPFSLAEAQVSLEVDISKNSDETVNMDFKVEGDSGASKLPKEYAFLKNAKLNYSLKGMKLDGLLAFQDFTKKIQAKQADIVSRLISPSTGEMDMKVYAELEAMQDETKYGMLALLPGILKKDSSAFDFAINLEDKEAKKSDLSLTLGFIGDKALPTNGKALEELFKTELLNLVSLDMNVKLEKEYIANLPMELQQALAGQLQIGAMMGIVKENNASYSFSAEVKPNKLMLNGEDRSAMLEMLDQSMAIGF